MSEQLRESLSAVMDGEADEFEIRRVLNEASRDASLFATWERYHLIGDVIAGRHTGAPSASPEDAAAEAQARVSARDVIWAALGDQDATAKPEGALAAIEVEAPRRAATSGRTGLFAGLGVAAAVALGVVVLFSRPGEAPTQAPVLAEATNPVPVAALTAPAVVDVLPDPTAEDRQRVEAYMLHHAQLTSMSNRGSAIPFVKVATYESN